MCVCVCVCVCEFCLFLVYVAKYLYSTLSFKLSKQREQTLAFIGALIHFKS